MFVQNAPNLRRYILDLATQGVGIPGIRNLKAKDWMYTGLPGRRRQPGAFVCFRCLDFYWVHQNETDE